MPLIRFAGVFSPKMPSLVTRGGIDRMLDAAPRLSGAQRRFRIDEQRGFGIGVVAAPYLGENLPDQQWLESVDQVVVLDGWVQPSEAGSPRREALAACAAAVAALDDGPMLEALAGEFAVAAWDREPARLRLANDPQGRRSVYYRYDPASGALYFASDARSVVAHPAIGRAPSLEGLSLFLNDGYIPAPFTGFEGVRKLRTGEVLSYSPGTGPETRIYWRYPERGDEGWELDQWSALVASTLRNGLKPTLEGQPRAGLFFSAGLDSTILAGLVQADPETALRVYTAGPPPETRTNELDFPHARRLATEWGLDQAELYLTPEVVAPHLLPVLKQFDEPSISALDAITFSLILGRSGSDGIGLCLTGYASGAFGLSAAGRAATKEGITSNALEGRLLSLIAEGRFFDAKRRGQLLTQPGSDVEWLVHEAVLPLWEANPSPEIEDRVSGGLRWARRRGLMFHSAEALQAIQPVRFRHPFGDWPSFRLGAVIPPRLRGVDDPGSQRVVLERAFADVVPEWVLKRKKRGMPGYVISDHTFASLEARLFAPRSIEATGLFHREQVERASAKKQLRKLIMLYLLWHELHINQNDDVFAEAGLPV